MIGFSSDLVLAQIGLGQGVAGGAVGLMIVAALALIGLVLAIIFGVSLLRSEAHRTRDLVFLVVGLALLSPAVLLVGVVFRDVIPRRKSWDLSAGRGTSLLGEKDDDPEMRERNGYTYSGNIQSSIKLPRNRQWSGKASSVYFRTRGGEIVSIQWSSPLVDARRAHQEARRIIGELAMGAEVEKDLDAWYANLARGGRRHFSTETQLEPGAKIEVMVTQVPSDPPDDPRWTVSVFVSWDEPPG